MNGRKAKKLRRAIYGEDSLKAARRYLRTPDLTPTDASCPRGASMWGRAARCRGERRRRGNKREPIFVCKQIPQQKDRD